MLIQHQPDGSLLLNMSQKQARDFAKTVIQHAEDAHTALLDFAYLLNEAHYDAENQFRQPPHAWEPGAHQPGTK
ncbi:MAG TPA: hypothetical protein VMV97_11660 [Sulfuriferula sp.]|nr:hypothetical protein [Sulfuriferula sp.]